MVGSAVVMQRMTYYERLLEYERRKKALQAAGLSNAEYERRVTDLARKLKV
jgi:hypothetical protein